MALDNKFRVSELVQSGSRAIISEDPISKTHTFIDGSTTIVSQSATEPYEHIEGERDGELTNYIEKPKYDETQLKKAVDTVIDELIVPPLPPSPPVVPKPVYDDLLERYNQAISDLAEANNTIRNLQAQVAQLRGQIQSLLSQLDAAQVARAIAENQLQQQATAFGDLTAKFSQAIIKATKEASARVSLEAQKEGLTAQKDTLREQILQLRQLVASLQGQVAAQLDILDAEQDRAKQREEQAQQQIEDLAEQAEEQQEAFAAAQLSGQPGTYGQGTKAGWRIAQSEVLAGKPTPLWTYTERDNRVIDKGATAINLFNYDTNPQSFTITVGGDASSSSWLSAARSITIPGRVGDKPGVGYFGVKWSPKTNDTKSTRNRTFSGNVSIKGALGDQFTIAASYKRQVDRADKWSSYGNTSTRSGSEKL